MKNRLISLLLILCLAFPVMGSALDRTLVKGMEGDDVLDAQYRLEYYQFYTGNMDGIFGADMRTAVIKFQRRNSLTADGKIGKTTWRLLESDNAKGANDPEFSTLKMGMSGENVKELQRQLRATYYYAGLIDGVFGSDVRKAVKNFQTSVGITADGVVGEKTYNALFDRTSSIFNGGIPRRNLSTGDRGYDVFVLQERLISLHYMSYDATGYYNTDTVAAVKAFQKAVGLKETGKADATLRRNLWPSTVEEEEEAGKQQQGTEDDPYQEPTLKLGAHGSNVASAQMRLKAGRYLLGKADGIFGKDTQAAVIALQKDYNLKQDGIIGASTWAILKNINIDNADPDVVDDDKPAVPAPTTKLKRGSSGAAVKKLQQQLIQLGYLSDGEDDGKFGAITQTAVKDFQRAQGIKADGVVGSQTYVRINEALGIQWGDEAEG